LIETSEPRFSVEALAYDPVPTMMPGSLPILHGRGSSENIPNRFEKIELQPDGDYLDAEEAVAPATVFYRDSSRSIIASNDSPDVGFEKSINAYRGCEHGCIYCYARPTHEWLGFSPGLDFETKIMVKENAAQLLRAELASPRWEPTTLSMSGVTDCYQPGERRFRLTRECLEVLREFRNPVGVITKNHLVTRDIDLLADMAKQSLAMAMISITTLDAELARKMEPRTSSPRRRLEAVRALANAGVPVGVMVAPTIPGLTDHEIPTILAAAADAGATTAGYVPVRLPFAVKDLFERWLSDHFPDRKEKVLNRIRSLRGGKLNDANFMTRMRGEGVWADQLKSMFKLAKRRAGLDGPFPSLTTEAFRRPTGGQLELWK
jgi:DNA repair photolyase